MNKGILKNLISSYTGPHDDLEHSQMLKTKEEIDKKLKKILMLVDDEHNDGKSEDQSQLVSLIEMFYHNYIFLHGRYDQLIGKVKKSIEHKEYMNGQYADSASSLEGSDSESSYIHDASQENGILCAEDKEQEERGDVVAKLAEAEAACLSLENEMQSTRERVNVLEAENTSLSLTLEKINQQHSAASERLLKIQEDNEALMSGKSALMQTLYDTESSIKELKLENQVLKDEIQKLKNEELKEVVEESDRLREENHGLRKTITDLEFQKSDLEKMLEDKGKEASEIADELKEVDIVLTTEYASDPQVEITGLNQENVCEDKKKHRFEMLSAWCKLLESKDKAIRQLEMNLEEKNVKIARLEDKEKKILEKLKLYERQKAQVDGEVGRLNELAQTLEVHLRLTNQKFKITKSEYKDREELHKRKMKELQQKYRELEEQNKDMKEEIHYMDCELNQVKEATEMGLTKMANALQNLELVFEESCGHFQTRIFECSEDVRVLKHSLRNMVHCKLRLEQNAEMASKAADFKERISDLEKIVRHKEEEGKLKDEEKREAIRQLCLQIDYHRENYKYLLQECLTRFRGTRKS